MHQHLSACNHYSHIQTHKRSDNKHRQKEQKAGGENSFFPRIDKPDSTWIMTDIERPC